MNEELVKEGGLATMKGKRETGDKMVFFNNCS
jgi:hypothetical protein